MQVFALHRQESYSRRAAGAGMRAPSGCCTSQKPRSSQGRVSGAPTGSSPYRLSMARSSRMAGGCSAPTEGNFPSGHARLTTAMSPVVVVDDRHVHRSARRRCRPTGRASVARPAAISPAASRQASARHDQARPRPVAVDRLALRDDVGERWHRPNPTVRRRSGTRRPAPAAYRCRRRARARDARTSARRRPAPCRSGRAARRTRCC